MCLLVSSHIDAVACFPLLLMGHLISYILENIARATSNARLQHSENTCTGVWANLWIPKWKMGAYFIGMNKRGPLECNCSFETKPQRPSIYIQSFHSCIYSKRFSWTGWIGRHWYALGEIPIHHGLLFLFKFRYSFFVFYFNASLLRSCPEKYPFCT